MKNRGTIRALIYGLVSLTLALTSCEKGGGVGAQPDNRGADRAEENKGINGGELILRAIIVTPNNPVGIHPGTRLQFAATGVFGDNAEENLTEVVA